MLEPSGSSLGQPAQGGALSSFVSFDAPLPLPSALRDARPRIDPVLARDTWQRTERFFRAIQDGSIAEVVSAYLPDARLEHPIIGHVAGAEIRQLWETFLRRTRTLRLDFTIVRVSAGTAFVDWKTEHEFFETGRQISMSGASSLTLAHGRIQFQHDAFDRHLWSAQAMGLSGLILSYLPGSRSFLRDESRRAFGLPSVQV